MLAGRGFVPVVYDDLSRGHREAVRWGPLEVGEISDGVRVKQVLERYHPAAVMHFAAFAYVGQSVEQPLLYCQNNVVGSATLLKATIDFKPLPFVFSSSCATYGVPEKPRITEDQPQRPINPYGSSKLFIEQMLAGIGRSWTAVDRAALF